MRRRRLFLLIAIGLALVFALGCGGRKGESSATTIHFRDPGLRIAFDYPAGWRSRRPDLENIRHYGFSPVLFLATQPLQRQCQIRKTKGGNAITCRAAIEKLFPGSVYVTISFGGAPGYTLADAKGEYEKIGRKSAKVDRERSGACAVLGADETITVQIESGIDIQACLRSPGLAARERELRSIFSSLRFLTAEPAATTSR